MFCLQHWLGPCPVGERPVEEPQVPEDAGAGGGEEVGGAVEIGLGTGGDAAFGDGLGDERGGQFGGRGALALGFGGFDQGVVLGEADSSDFPVNVD